MGYNRGMKYITDIHALNMECDLGTMGDWHRSGIDWSHPRTLESESTPWGDWGIEVGSSRAVPLNPGPHNIANHVRALCDMVLMGRFRAAEGMGDEFLDGDSYDSEVFSHIAMLAGCENWDAIDRFMAREYGRRWFRFLDDRGLSLAASAARLPRREPAEAL